MYTWIIKTPNLLAYLGNSSVAFHVEENHVELSVTTI